MSACRLLAFVVTLVVGFSSVASAQTDPRTLPTANLSGVRAVGTWTYDWPDGAGGDISYGGGALGVSEDGKYIYISCVMDHSGIAKLEIPAPGGRARVVSPCAGPKKADIAKIHPDPNAFRPMLGGVLELNGRMTVTGYISYDATGQTTASHWGGTGLSSLQGPFAGTVATGMVKSQMAPIPQEWRALLGGPALASAGYTSIISRASYGASVSVFDPATVTANGFPMKMLLGCPHSVVGCITYGTATSNDYNGSELSGGFFIVPNTRTLVVIEREASGPTCYGYATRNQADHGKPYLDAVYCYSLTDPMDQKGPKGYPYRLVAKLYDLNELVAVKQGTKNPWDVRQYATVDLPGSNPGEYVTSGVYNPVRGEYYMLRYAGGGVNTIYVYDGFGGSTVTPPPAVEICGDGIDNDKDGLVDEGCTVTPPPAEICGDGIDNDKDGLVDEGCTVTPPPAEVCGDGIDNDKDGLVDEGCTVTPPPAEVCGDGIDNDKDGLVDEGCEPPAVEVCGDGKDNDADGLVDEGCATAVAVPGQPRRLYSSVSKSTVNFKWYPPITGGAVSDYVLEAGVAPGTTFFSAPVGATSLSVPNVGTGRYYVRVKARNANGAGASSNEVTVSVGCYTRPRKVSGLRATTSGGLVTLTWTDPDGCSGTSYEVSLADSAATTSRLLATDSPEATTLLAAGTYTARVQTRSEAGVSEPTTMQFTVGDNTCGTPRLHLGLRQVVAGRRVGLFWSPLDPDVAAADDAVAPVSYVLEAGTAPGVTNIGAVPMGRAAQFITDVPAGTYYVRVRAGNACGGGLASNEVKLVVR
jgi:Putative metal-binding motif